jgi:hypothetical protein
MGTNSAPLLADLYLYSYEAEYIQKLLHENHKPQHLDILTTFYLSIMSSSIHMSIPDTPVILKLKALQNHLLLLYTLIF